MDAGKEIGGTAAIAAVRMIAAPDAIGLLTPKGELSAADGMRPSLPRTHAGTATSPTVAPTVAELSDGAQLLLKLLGASGQPGREGDVRRSRVGGMGGIWGDGVSGCHSDGLGPRRLQGALP